MGFSGKMQVMSYILKYRKSYFDSLKTFEVIDAESPIVIFFGTYGRLTLRVFHTRINPI